MSFVSELKRRKVFQVAAVYLVVAWLIMQVVDVVNEPLSLPDWFDTVVILLLGIGFPLAVILSWAFDLTPKGVVREDGSPAPVDRRTLNYTILGLAILAVTVMFVDAYVPEGEPASADAPVNRRSIAVLPFDNRSAEAEDQFFVDGIHDDILSNLVKIGGLKVISRTSVMEYRDVGRNMREIGEALGVATILEGGVQRAGDTIRINVQLIDANTDTHLWAEIYDREMTAENIFAIQSEIAVSIADALETTLTPAEQAQISDVPTRNLRAHDFYLLAKEYTARGDDPLAEQMLIQATEEDPEFVGAWIDLAWAHSLRYWNDEATEARRQLAYDAVQRAVELSPDSPKVHWALGNYHYRTDRDYDRALAEYAIAEQGLPGDSQVPLSRAFVQRRVSQWSEAHQSFDRAIDLDPRNTGTLYFKAETYLALRDYESAEEYFDRSIALQPDAEFLHSFKPSIPLLRDGDGSASMERLADARIPHGDYYYWQAWQAAVYERDYGAALEHLGGLNDNYFLEHRGYHARAALYGLTYQLAGDRDLARAHFQAGRTQLESLLETRPRDARLHVSMGETLAALGEYDAAIEAARRGMALLSVERDTFLGPAVQLDAAVRVFVAAGDHDAALAELDAYFSRPGIWSIEGLAPDPRLDPIRDDPRFQALVEKYRRE